MKDATYMQTQELETCSFKVKVVPAGDVMICLCCSGVLVFVTAFT